jgi:hypothetical protein
MQIERRMDLAVEAIEDLKFEHAELKGRVEWLEARLVELLRAIIGLLSLAAAFIAYDFTVGSVGGLIAFGIGAGAFLIMAWWLQRVELKGAPE